MRVMAFSNTSNECRHVSRKGLKTTGKGDTDRCGYPKISRSGLSLLNITSVPIALLVLLFHSVNIFAEESDVGERFDVIVYGATAAGTMAAIAAAQHRMHVALIEPGAHVGGMVSGGL